MYKPRSLTLATGMVINKINPRVDQSNKTQAVGRVKPYLRLIQIAITI